MIIGEAIGNAGPSIIISFALAGVTCLFSAFSYAELASSIPVSGSAYTYGYATLGELVAWIIGWDLILEYGVAVAAVAVGWGGYLKSLLDSLFGITCPSRSPARRRRRDVEPARGLPRPRGGGAADLRRARERADEHLHGRHEGRHPHLLHRRRRAARSTATTSRRGRPHGFSGTVDAAALIFFAYIGFDAISTSGEEAENPSRDLPFAIIGALLICTLLYILVAVVTVGLAPASKLAGSDAPLATALQTGAGHRQLGGRHPLGGSADRHHERDPHRPLRPDADHVRDEPRRPRAPLGRQAQPAPDAGAASRRPSACWWPSSPRSCR